MERDSPILSLIMNEYEEKVKKDYFSKFGWKRDPFILRGVLPHPSLYVRRKDDHQRLGPFIEALKEGQSVSLVVGPVGSGKSTLLKLFDYELERVLGNCRVVFIEQPGFTQEQFMKLVLSRINSGMANGDKVSLYENLKNWVNGSRDRRLILMIDEAPEIPEETGRLIRNLSDMENISFILSGVPDKIAKSMEKMQPLLDRKGSEYEVKPFESPELTWELIARRICYAKGDFSELDIRPFTDEAIEKIHEMSGGSPREALRIAHDALRRAMVSKNYEIDEQLVAESGRSVIVTEGEILREFSEVQRKIITLLRNKPEGLLIREIYESLGITHNTAKTSLKRLRNKGVVRVCRRKGRAYIYCLSEEWRRRLMKG